MTDKTEKPNLKIVNKETDLTIKQRAFVDEIIKGKLGSYKEAYAKVYDVTLTKQGKIPKWVEVEASKLVANPKIALSLHKAIQRKEDSSVASSLRTRNYVLERLMSESKEADSDSTRVRALELLGKTVSLFNDTIEIKEARDSETIEEEIEEKIVALLKEAEADQ
jgi:organic radical activating enzyme